MREFSKIKCTIWQSRKFSLLNEASKLFYFYLHTNGRVNSCGCYNNPLGYIMVDLSWTAEKISGGYRSCIEAGLIQYDAETETVYIENFFSVSAPQNPKHAIKILADIDKIPSKKLKALCAEELRNFIANTGWKIEADFLYRIDRLISTGTMPPAQKKESRNEQRSAPSPKSKGNANQELKTFLDGRRS